MALLMTPIVILALIVVLIVGFMVIFVLVGWLGSLVGRRERIARWEVALTPDPDDPEGLTPVVRLVERELEAALARAGTRLVNRAVRKSPDDTVRPPHVLQEAWVSGDIAGAGVTVSISSDMVTLNESRLEAQGYPTPDLFCADAVATAMRMIPGARSPAVGAKQKQNWEALVAALILAAIVLWVILALPAPAFVPK